MRRKTLYTVSMAIAILGLITTGKALAQRPAGSPFICDGGPIMKVHEVPIERIDLIVTALEYKYKGVVTVRAWKLGKDRVMIWAMPADQDEIITLIRKLTAASA